MKSTKRPARRNNPTEQITVGQRRFMAIFTPAEEGGYVVTCPALPGVVTEGDTLREARRMAEEAIAGYIEVLVKHNQPIPTDKVRAEMVDVEIYA
jgi:predicted RNase H-like HicB family nuclease